MKPSPGIYIKPSPGIYIEPIFNSGVRVAEFLVFCVVFYRPLCVRLVRFPLDIVLSVRLVSSNVF